VCLLMLEQFSAGCYAAFAPFPGTVGIPRANEVPDNSEAPRSTVAFIFVRLLTRCLPKLKRTRPPASIRGVISAMISKW
jgi:hypothetical protein